MCSSCGNTDAVRPFTETDRLARHTSLYVVGQMCLFLSQYFTQQHTLAGQQQLLGEDVHIIQAAASLARFLAQWPEPADTNQLMHGLTLVPPLLKILDAKKHTCATKQAAMELLGQLSLFSDAYRTDTVTHGGVAALVRQLRCEQPGCQKDALLALHRLLVMSKQRTGLLGDPMDQPEV